MLSNMTQPGNRAEGSRASSPKYQGYHQTHIVIRIYHRDDHDDHGGSGGSNDTVDAATAEAVAAAAIPAVAATATTVSPAVAAAGSM